MKYFITLCLILLSLTAGQARAEGGCPPGQYPQQGQGWQTCVPIPGYNQGQDQVTPPPLWQSRWQAISTDVDKAVLGKSIDTATQKDAEKLALQDCQTQGGTNCKIAISYGNGCVALAAGDVLVSTGSGASKPEAEQRAIGKCATGAKDCRVYYSACSPPVRIQ
ncbi:DUF4189 domain-containing protein [Luteibacter sp.]|uniref:DUF4189 domain-containing protein n=1 Tax=Luteibacter sp. TaxID=1886636 RepID=UPI0039C8E8E3